VWASSAEGDSITSGGFVNLGGQNFVTGSTGVSIFAPPTNSTTFVINWASAGAFDIAVTLYEVAGITGGIEAITAGATGGLSAAWLDTAGGPSTHANTISVVGMAQNVPSGQTLTATGSWTNQQLVGAGGASTITLLSGVQINNAILTPSASGAADIAATSWGALIGVFF
jgi:hypothetical protein